MNAAKLRVCEQPSHKDLAETGSQGKKSGQAQSALDREPRSAVCGLQTADSVRAGLARNLNQEWEDEFLTVLEGILADLAAQERVLRDRSRRETPLKDDLNLLGFGYRLWMSRFNANADAVLGRFVLGKDVMRHVNDRLLQHTPAMPDVPRFRLYNTTGQPTVSGVQVWREMRKRLLRGANPLARSLKLEYGY